MLIVFLFLIITIVLSYQLFSILSNYSTLISTKHRFRLFAMRDRLACLVLHGEVDQNSDEFVKVLSVINYTIANVERVSFFSYIKAYLLSEKTSDVPEGSEFLAISSKAIAEISMDYLDVIYSIIKRNSRFQLVLLRVLSFFISKNDEKNRKTNIINEPSSMLQGIANKKNELIQNFGI